MNILIAEKSLLIANLFKDELADNRDRVFAFHNARLALSHFKEIQPDLIISGGRFSDSYSGMEFLSDCRKKLKYIKTFVIISSYPTHTPIDYFNNGANFFIDKNNGLENTIKEIKSILSHSRSTKDSIF